MSQRLVQVRLRPKRLKSKMNTFTIDKPLHHCQFAIAVILAETLYFCWKWTSAAKVP